MLVSFPNKVIENSQISFSQKIIRFYYDEYLINIILDRDTYIDVDKENYEIPFLY